MRSIGFVVMSAAFALVSVGCSNVSTQGQTGNTLTVTEVIPSSGPIAGNVPVQIKGTGFTSDSLSVKFGANAMGNPTLVDAQTLHGTLPAATAAGQVDVVVSCAGKTATLPHGFTYSNSTSAITITGISPNNGPLGGGTQVTITGTGFQGGQTSVMFGGNAGSGVTVTADSQLSVLTPPGAANGAVAVAVTNQHGTATLPNSFVYGNGGGGGGGQVQTTKQHLDGLSELDYVSDFTSGSEVDSTEGFAYYFTAQDVTIPATGTCALDLDNGVTSTLDAGTVTFVQGTTNFQLNKDTSSGTPVYNNTAGASSVFAMATMAGVTATGSGTLAAFNPPSVAQAPAADYDAKLAYGIENFSGGGAWSPGDSGLALPADLQLSWSDNGGNGVDHPVNHVQVVVVGQDLLGTAHVLACDVEDTTTDAAASFCVKGGYSNDLCQTSGSTMKDFYDAIGGSTTGFGSATIYFYRGNRGTYAVPTGAANNAALDVNIVKATALTMAGS